MSKKTIGLIVAIVGLLGALVSALADVIGVGRDVGFGAQQTTGTIGGAVVLIIGIVIYLQSNRSADQGPP